MSQNSKGQQVENLDIQKVENNFIITFDLKYVNNPHERYNIDVYASHDGFTKPLELKDNDNKKFSINKNVIAKLKNRFVVDAQKNFTGFKGSINFKVIATMVFEPVSFVSPTEELKIKSGKSVTIMWKGGMENDSYHLDFSTDNSQTWNTLEKNISDNKYNWYVPKKIKSGTYNLKLTSGESRSVPAYSGNIAIKKKKSPFIFIIPVVAIAGVSYFLLKGDDAGSSTLGIEDVPAPPSISR